MVGNVRNPDSRFTLDQASPVTRSRNVETKQDGLLRGLVLVQSLSVS